MLEIILEKWIWLLMASAASFSALTVFTVRYGKGLAWRMKAAVGFHLFFGLWFAVLGTGHLVAITAKALTDQLPQDVGLLFLVPFGLALVLPGCLLLMSLPGMADLQTSSCRTAAAADLWLAVLLALTAAPLAAVPAAGLFLLTSLVEDWADLLCRPWTREIRKSPSRGGN
ncbi:MAG TPA: hypothetical protein VLU25_21620 [Acidobacteriota bacterium]|nr:hypothetical protein [Acidobacteriota bacterium]